MTAIINWPLRSLWAVMQGHHALQEAALGRSGLGLCSLGWWGRRLPALTNRARVRCSVVRGMEGGGAIAAVQSATCC